MYIEGNTTSSDPLLILLACLRSIKTAGIVKIAAMRRSHFLLPFLLQAIVLFAHAQPGADSLMRIVREDNDSRWQLSLQDGYPSSKGFIELLEGTLSASST